jgi:hypothetical protein
MSMGAHTALPRWPDIWSDAPDCYLCHWVPWAGRWRVKTPNRLCHHGASLAVLAGQAIQCPPGTTHRDQGVITQREGQGAA